jgi:hypothetical protein
MHGERKREKERERERQTPADNYFQLLFTAAAP